MQVLRSLAAIAFVVAAATGVLPSTGLAQEVTAIIQGGAQPLGKGMAYAWAGLDATGVVRSVGLNLTDAALTGLPSIQRVLLLDLPEPARRAGYDHVGLNWEPHGHDPNGVYDKPHFDVHFYHIPAAQHLAILPSDPQYLAKMGKLPPAGQLFVGYIRPPGTDVPMMGTHWINPKSPEFNGQPFTHTLIQGSYDGAVIFIEPMMTLAQLEKRTSVSAPIPAPVSTNRLVPKQYTIGWDANAGEHRISLDDLAPVPAR